jgi:hypothetical protein
MKQMKVDKAYRIHALLPFLSALTMTATYRI